jgi:hypothetical protein
MKLSITSIVLYFVLKYFLLSILIVLFNVGISFFDENIIDTINYLFFCFVVPTGVPIAIILIYPIYLINRVNNLKIVLALFFCSLIFEIIINSILSSQRDKKILILNFSIGLILWFLFLFRKIQNWQT